MMTDAPVARDARLDILLVGSLTPPGVVSTCSLVRSDHVVAVVDPGMAARQSDILDPLAALGVAPGQVTDVILSHHHPDHTLNAGLFPNARVHDHWAIYRGMEWTDRDAEGYELTPSVRLIRTPGHTAEDISTVVGTTDHVAVLTHLWWHAGGPEEDPYAQDPAALLASRQRVLTIAELIVPGHGAPFEAYHARHG
jgi:glyoxylase-like metal-dependent hydrolase (beta-lactamase superfamily II)